MPAWVMINGVWRALWSIPTVINDEFKENDIYVKVNGEWRNIYKHNVTIDDICGFKIVYRLARNKKHVQYPNLTYNKNIPVEVKLTGDSIGNMDLNPKGIVFRYMREKPDEEGIVAYEGNIYAILNNKQAIDIGFNIDEVGKDEVIKLGLPNLEYAWKSNKLSNFSIKLKGYELYESYGYYMAGWNSLFTTEQFLDKTNYPDKEYHEDINILDMYNLLPSNSRDPKFHPISTIGIARDMKSPTNNMIGSYGTLDHTINEIIVNDIKKPFVIELYND